MEKETKYETVNTTATMIDSLSKTMKTVADAAKGNEQAIQILTDMLNIDKDEFKQKLIVAALTNAKENKDFYYPGHLGEDSLELILKLIEEKVKLEKENAGLKEDLKRKADLFDSLRDSYEHKIHIITVAKNALRNPEVSYVANVQGMRPKGKYTNKDVLDMLCAQSDAYEEEMRRISNILVNPDEECPTRRNRMNFIC